MAALKVNVISLKYFKLLLITSQETVMYEQALIYDF